jgi:hypothetical protein
VVVTDPKGKQRKRYPYDQMMTPYEKLKSLTKAETFLKAGLTFKQLDEITYPITAIMRPNNNSSIPSLNRTTGRPDLPPPWHASITFVQYNLWIRKYYVTCCGFLRNP